MFPSVLFLVSFICSGVGCKSMGEATYPNVNHRTCPE